MTAPIGSAAVAVISDTTGFKRDLDTKLARINPKVKVGLDITPLALRQFKRDAQNALNKLNLEVRVKPVLGPGSLTELKRGIEAWSRGSGLAGGIEVAVNPVLARGSRVSLQRQLDDLTPPLTVRVTPILGDIDRRGLGGVSSTTVRADVDKKSFGEALIYINRLGSAMKALALPAVAAASIPTLLGIAAAAAEAAQAAALLPAVLTAGAFAFGAIKIGTQGFGEALKNVGDPEKFAEAIATLSPAARESALAVQALKPAFDSFKNSVQDALFRDLADVIRDLGENALPVLESSFVRIASSANSTVLGLGEILTTSSRLSDLGSIGDNSATAFGNLLAAVKPLAGAFLDAAQVGGTFLPGLTAGAGGAAQAFADMVREARETGKLGEFIQQGLDALKQMGSIAGNVGSALSGIFSAGNITGGGFLNTLDSITGSLAEVINSVSGQDALQSFFSVTSVIAETLGDTLKALAPSLAVILDAAEQAITAIAPAVAPLAQAAGEVLAAFAPLLPVIGDLGALVAGLLTDALKQLLPPVSRLVKSLADALAPVLPVLAAAFGDIVDALGPVVEVLAGALADAVTMIAPILGEVATIVGKALTQAIRQIQPYLPQIADAFNQILEAIVPLLPEIARMATEFITNMLPALLELIPSFLDLTVALLPLLPPLVELTGAVLPLLSTLLSTTVVPALKTLALIIDNVVVPVLDGLLIPVLETGIGVLTILTDTLNFVLETFNRVFLAIQDVVIQILQITVLPLFQKVVDFLNLVFTSAINGLGAAWDLIWRGMGSLIDSVVKGPIMGAFGALKTGLQGVQDFAGGVVTAITDTWSKMTSVMAKPINFFLVRIWNDGLVKAWNAITGWIPGLGDKVKLGPLAPVPEHFATGGPVGGTGTGDTVPALLTPGEFVVRRQIAKPARRFLSALNAGQAEAWQAAGGRNAVGPTRFAAGGLVASEHVARGAVGKPYVWGATGPNSFDCSGLWSAITNAALGVATYGNRRFATASFGGGGAGGLTPGRGALTVGVQPGHMAGTLSGTNYEATPPRVRGPGALGATNFPRQFFLPQIGGQFVAGSGGSGGGGGFFDFIGKIMDTFNPIKAMIDPGIDALMPGDGPYKDVAKRIPHLTVDAVIDRAKELATDLLGLGTDLFTGAVGGIAGGLGDASVRQQVAQVSSLRRWNIGQNWAALDWLITKESSWNPRAQNPRSTAYGLYQFLDSTWATVGGHKTSDPSLQAKFGNQYIANRYGDPMGAKAFHQSHNWYANGGVATSPAIVGVGEAGAEAIMPLRMLAGLIKNILRSFFSTISTKPTAPGQPYLPAASLPGFQQIQRSDSPLRTAGSSLQDWQARIDAERRRIESQVNTFNIALQNYGVLGAQRDVQRWLQLSLQQLQREGKLPQGVRVS